MAQEDANSKSTFASRLASFAQARKPQTSELTGTIESVRMFGEDWGLATMWTQDGKSVKLTGRVSDLKEDAEYSVTAQMKTHPKYGESFEVLGARPHVQLNATAMVKFIKNNFKGIGQVSAVKYVSAIEAQGGATALAALREKLLNEPWTVDFTAIKREGTFDGSEKDKTVHAFIQRDLATRISGLPSNVLSALADYLVIAVKAQEKASKFGSSDPVGDAWRLLSLNPYGPIAKVTGYGFLSADTIGRLVKIPRDAPVRLAALVAHAVTDKCETYGHVYLTLEQAKEGIIRVDGIIGPTIAIEHALEAGTIELDVEGAELRLYPRKLMDAEIGLAKQIAGMCEAIDPLMHSESDKDLAARVQETAKQLGGAFRNGLDNSQLKALTGILTSKSRLHTITAEPGAGKTAVMEVLTKFLPHKKFLFCAPTGKGAKVLSNRLRSVGCYASTIHSLLMGEPEGGFGFNAGNQLDGDVLVVDEGSMPDLELAAAVFAAANDDMHIIILGDVDQLPSIAPGSVLADVLKITEADHHRLTTVHRNSGGILDVIREVNAGQLKPTNRPGVQFSGSLAPASEGFNALVIEYMHAVSRSGYDGTALLMSRRKGDINEPGWNTTYANAVLREVCNPNARKLPGSTLCDGDRIILKSNMTIKGNDDEPTADVRVVNGDTGAITGFTLKSAANNASKRDGGVETVHIKLDDGRAINFPGSALQSIQLGYALTVHAAQGSEYRDVIAVITPGMPTFINRNMLYTGLSRARVNLSVHGNDLDLRKVAATPMPKRNSGLVQRVESELVELNRESTRGVHRERRSA